MVEVTDADREAAKQHQQRFLTEGASETSLLWEAFARHRIAEEDLAEYIGKRVMDDADKLRLFMPECYARFPLEWDGHLYEISVVYRGPEFKGS